MFDRDAFQSPELTQRDLRRVLFAGFSAVILTLVVVTVTGLYRMLSINEQIEQIITEHNRQVEFITRMRTAARERSLLLQSMSNELDPFERDEMQMALLAWGDRYLKAEQALRATELDEEEQAIMAELVEAVRYVYPLQREVMDLLATEQYEQARAQLLHSALPAQEAVVALMDRFADLQREHNAQAQASGRRQFKTAVIMMLAAGLLAVVLSILVARSVMARIGKIVDDLHHYGSQIRRVNDELVEEIKTRARMESELRSSEARERVIREHILEPIITIDEEGVIQSCNGAAERMFGYPHKALLGSNISVLMPEPHRSAHDGYLRDYRKGAPRRVIGQVRQLEAQKRSGERFMVELRVTEVKLDEGRLFVGVFRPGEEGDSVALEPQELA